MPETETATPDAAAAAQSSAAGEGEGKPRKGLWMVLLVVGLYLLVVLGGVLWLRMRAGPGVAGGVEPETIEAPGEFRVPDPRVGGFVDVGVVPYSPPPGPQTRFRFMELEIKLGVIVRGNQTEQQNIIERVRQEVPWFRNELIEVLSTEFEDIGQLRVPTQRHRLLENLKERLHDRLGVKAVEEIYIVSQVIR